MKIVLSARVEADIAAHFQYGVDRFGHATAARTFARVDRFLHQFLAAHPRTGNKIALTGFYESWISGTPFVIIYRIDDTTQTVVVLAMFRHSQDRSDFESD